MSLMTGIAALLNLTTGPWIVVNDDVMGGRSTASVEASDGRLRFEGILSLENNGGFSSTRRAVSGVPAGTRGVRLEVRGDGREYQLRLRQDRRFDGVSWRAAFETGEDWTTVDLPFGEFDPVFRGRAVPAAGPVKPESISQLGFLLADGEAGDFLLEVREMGFFGEE